MAKPTAQARFYKRTVFRNMKSPYLAVTTGFFRTGAQSDLRLSVPREQATFFARITPETTLAIVRQYLLANAEPSFLACVIGSIFLDARKLSISSYQLESPVSCLATLVDVSSLSYASVVQSVERRFVAFSQDSIVNLESGANWR